VIALLGAIAAKLVLVSDLAVIVQYAPHDDGLYVMRAYYLLTGEGFGPYDPRTLVKLPGMSFWLAGTRLLGMPYLWSVNMLYIVAGIYFATGALRCGVSRPIAFASFVIYLFSPITMGNEWMRVLREPLSTGLLVTMFASSLFILNAIAERRRKRLHLAIFGAAFAFSVLLREEDVLLYAVPFLLAAGAWLIQSSGGGGRVLRPVVAIVIVPVALSAAANFAARSFVEQHYGLPILHDFNQGEFPKLIAAIRSIESKKDNRYVMITQERLAKLVAEVPRFAPVIERLPPPGPGTYSCQILRVCTEWANGHMPFWIKDAAGLAGLTPDLASAQEYFRAVRLDIERACAEGRLKCKQDGDGLLPPFSPRWTRAFVREFVTLLGMTVAPHPHLADATPARFEVDVQFGRIFQHVTMTHHFDTALQLSDRNPPGPRFTLPLAAWRTVIASLYQPLAAALIVLTVAGFILRLALRGLLPFDAVTITVAIFLCYTAIRLLAISYVAVYLGHFDNRLVYATHSMFLIIGPAVIADALRTWRQRKEPMTYSQHPGLQRT
jgi:hypothetical protein